ncbi:hypothetical protein GCM10007989_11250 [Devosia pacifica]|uniref:3-mercaptopyruvate sulfurtransferase n=1 Tax=Devosia pacifica TaxID=1335967 RepID=A0A918VRW0_9HYPH|nr:3-mercaptopyruvate sulfurtransferase [Devosia pacifica]GHA17800.1 hypothetical protein GCM10007989_11250 [Devosia pacifica]
MADTPFVSTQWLEEALGRSDVAIVDASWYLPGTDRDAEAEFTASHIPGAVFFDLDKIADQHTALPHMLPTPEFFASVIGQMGISEDMTIVIYDEAGLFSAPRVWWTFRAMGAKDVRILSGGGKRWREESRPLATGWPYPPPTQFKAAFDQKRVADLAEVEAASKSGGQILDARPAPRFAGEQPEPREGLRSGHIPSSRNLPASTLIENGELISSSAILKAVTHAGIDPEQPVITTCGSGVTAAILALALETVGNGKVRVYDGSWADWGSHSDTEVATGNN